MDKLFKEIDEHHPPIVELSDYAVVKDDPRRDQALQLASEHDIPIGTAYNIIDEKITLTEVLRRKPTRNTNPNAKYKSRKRIVPEVPPSSSEKTAMGKLLSEALKKEK